MGHYRVLDDVALADCALEIDGRDPADVFATAAAALADVMVDPPTLAGEARREIALAAPALDLLLYDFLAELIFRKDRDLEVFPTAEVCVSGDGPFALAATLAGGRIDAATTALRADAKAVTMHELRVEPSAEGWRARVVIDI